MSFIYYCLLTTASQSQICLVIISIVIRNDQFKLLIVLSMCPKASLIAKFLSFIFSLICSNQFCQGLVCLSTYIIDNPKSKYRKIDYKHYYYPLITNNMFKKRNTKNNSIDLSQIKQEGDQQGKPHKKVKVEKPEMHNLIGGSTSMRKNDVEEQVHKQFQSLSYKRGKGDHQDSNILVGDEAIDHQTEQAKRKYMQNVEITKKIKEGKLSTKIYRGSNNYANYKLSENELQNPAQHYKWKHGPIRSNNNNNTKNTCRFDYDPSLCKDWHDNGYCVFGNSCIYLHDRSNYKTGWELEKDFEKSERERWKRIMNPDLNEEPDYIKDLEKYKPQQICKYCNQVLEKPVQVSCQHVFCRKCADQIITKNSKCVECQKMLNGIMNNAEKTLAKQKQNYEQMLKTAQKTSEITLTKRSKFKDANSLQVFASQ